MKKDAKKNPQYVDVLVAELDNTNVVDTPLAKESATSVGDGDQVGANDGAHSEESHRSYEHHGLRSS